MTAATDEFDLDEFDLDVRIDSLDPADPADPADPDRNYRAVTYDTSCSACCTDWCSTSCVPDDRCN